MNRHHLAFAAGTFVLAASSAFAQMGGYSAPTPQPERRIEAPAQKDVPNTSTAAAVQFAVDAPKPKCEDPGAYPGRVGMQTEDRRNKFLKSIETYKTCMMNFVEERKAVIKANETSARQAIEDFNVKMKKYQEEQEKAKE
jgi:hypothetical protein